MLFPIRKLISSSSSSSPSSSIFFMSVFILRFLISSGEAIIMLPKNVRIPAIVAFGDSVADQGNNNNLNTIAKCNFRPYGNDFIGEKPTGRFTNGKTIVDLTAEELGIKELVPAYLDPNLQAMDLPTGVSFASGGSGFDPQTPRLTSAFSIPDQVKMFKEYIGKLKGMVGEESTNDILSHSIIIVIAGTNDLINSYFTGIRRLQYDIDSYTHFLVESASNFIKELYELGGKRLAIFGIPPIGCLPSQRTLAGGEVRECSESYNKAAQLYNTKLRTSLNSLNTNFNDSTKARVVYVDIYNPILDIIQNRDKYGLAVVDRGCCGTGLIEVLILCNKLSKTCLNHSAYLFWDSFHPTEQGYKILINQLIQNVINNLL